MFFVNVDYACNLSRFGKLGNPEMLGIRTKARWSLNLLIPTPEDHNSLSIRYIDDISSHSCAIFLVLNPLSSGPARPYPPSMSTSESQPLLTGASEDVVQYGNSEPNSSVPLKKHIGVFSAVFIIFNRIIGTGYVMCNLTTYLLDVSLL